MKGAIGSCTIPCLRGPIRWLPRPQKARADARRADRKADALEFDVERLLMISEALWSILKEQHGYTDEELQSRILQIDMRDGKLDGRVADSPPGAAQSATGLY